MVLQRDTTLPGFVLLKMVENFTAPALPLTYGVARSSAPMPATVKLFHDSCMHYSIRFAEITN